MPAAAPPRFLGLDLNTLDDFFVRGAPLAVHHAESVRGHLRALVKVLREAGVPVLAGLDAHQAGDAEFKAHQLPPHALAGTPGRQRLAETILRGAPVIPAGGQRRPWPDMKTWRDGGEIVLEKKEFDLFSNPACRELLRLLAPDELLLYGATLEQDLRATAFTARTLALSVTVVYDASGWRDGKADVRARQEMAQRGVHFEPAEEVCLRLTDWKRRTIRLERAGKPGAGTQP